MGNRREGLMRKMEEEEYIINASWWDLKEGERWTSEKV
jgi:hypothetical protein